jgi:hypothetical protein
VRDALKARAEHLVAQGLAHRQGPHIVPAPGLLATLRHRELDTAGARLAAETGLAYTPPAGGEKIAGTYRKRLALTSGRFAMIDNGVGFALVPWTPALEKHLGRRVSGVAKENSGIDRIQPLFRDDPVSPQNFTPFRVRNVPSRQPFDFCTSVE